MVAADLPPLLVNLGAGMSKLSNLAMSIAIGLIAFVTVVGPTEYLMNAIVTSFGEYVRTAILRGFQTLNF